MEISCEPKFDKNGAIRCYKRSEKIAVTMTELRHSSTTVAEGVVHGIDWPEWLPVSNYGISLGPTNHSCLAVCVANRLSIFEKAGPWGTNCLASAMWLSDIHSPEHWSLFFHAMHQGPWAWTTEGQVHLWQKRSGCAGCGMVKVGSTWRPRNDGISWYLQSRGHTD